MQHHDGTIELLEGVQDALLHANQHRQLRPTAEARDNQINSMEQWRLENYRV